LVVLHGGMNSAARHGRRWSKTIRYRKRLLPTMGCCHSGPGIPGLGAFRVLPPTNAGV
jgi:hypothetical protein